MYEGLELWLSADNAPGGEGDTIYKWPDDSGNDYHADNVQGIQLLKVSSLNGHNVIAFDGSDDLLWTSQNFDGLANGYTLFTVSRYAGNPKGRVIGSKTQNWLWGFHNGGVHKWHPNGWVSNHGGGDTNWHIHSGDINNAGDPQANFWTDGAQKATNRTVLLTLHTNLARWHLVDSGMAVTVSILIRSC